MRSSAYSSTGVVDFMQPLLDEYFTKYPNVQLFLRGDSGFATPDLYRQCETNGVSYAIRLKANKTLFIHEKHLEDEIAEATKDNMIGKIGDTRTPVNIDSGVGDVIFPKSEIKVIYLN